MLQRLDRLRAAFEAAQVSAEHVDAIAQRALPARLDAIAAHDATLTRLACAAQPHEVGVAVRHIIDQVDADGADDPPGCTNDDLRQFRVHRGFGGLGVVSATTTPLLTELLLRVRDVYATPDPADTPVAARRTPAQRFHDAVHDALTVALDHHPGAAVDGVKAHVVLFADVATLLGDDERARIRPRLAASGVIDPELARHLVATTNPTLRAVLGLGPWQPVTVGRARRTLPDWLRGASQLAHHHCRGVGCDRPFAWTEADHADDWATTPPPPWPTTCPCAAPTTS